MISAVAAVAIGGAWYSVFASPWMVLGMPGRTREAIDAGPKSLYAVAFAMSLVMASALAVLLAATGTLDSLPDALGVALVAWVGFVAASFATTFAFEWKSTKLLAINTGYHLASMLASAAILALWP